MESADLKYLNDSKAFIEYSDDMNNIHKHWKIQSKLKAKNIDCI